MHALGFVCLRKDCKWSQLLSSEFGLRTLFDHDAIFGFVGYGCDDVKARSRFGTCQHFFGSIVCRIDVASIPVVLRSTRGYLGHFAELRGTVSPVQGGRRFPLVGLATARRAGPNLYGGNCWACGTRSATEMYRRFCGVWERCRA